MEIKRFCLGDIHGAYKALMQVIEKSGIDYDNDLLISLGDVADGWSQVPECFEELMKFKNLIYILGNHDRWLLDYFKTYNKPRIWTSQGGEATLNAYYRVQDSNYEQKHEKFLENAKPYYITKDNKLFVHGGFSLVKDISKQSIYDLTWDRDLFWSYLFSPIFEVKDYDEIYIGHTTTSRTKSDLSPVHIRNLWNIDQGAGWEGKLTIINIDTKEFWQSDLVKNLYPDGKGR